MLAHQRRALLVQCLTEFHEPVSLPDLADEVAVREYDEELTALTGEQVKEIYLSLYHTHVPKLAEAGLIEYDQESDHVVSAPDVDLDGVVADTNIHVGDTSNR